MNKTVKKNEDAKVLETLCAELEVNFESKRENDAEIKRIKEKVLEIIDRDPHKYFEGNKSFKVGAIEIAIKTKHTYELGGEFDLHSFYKKYPNAVKIELKHANMVNIPLEKFDITHKDSDSTEIAYKAVKEKV